MSKRGDSAGRHQKSIVANKEEKSLKAKIVRTKGKVFIEIVDPAMRDGQRIEVSEWTKAGPIADTIYEVIRKNSLATRSGPTRYEFRNSLKNGLLQFLTTKRSELGTFEFSDINSELVQEFRRWLDSVVSLKTNKPLTLASKRRYYGAMRKLAACAKKIVPRVAVSYEVQDNPWPRAVAEEKTEKGALPVDVKEALIAAVANDTLELMKRVWPVLKNIEGSASKPVVSKTNQDNDKSLDLLIKKYDGLVPERKMLSEEDRNTIDKIGYTTVRQALYPQANDLIAPLILLQIFVGGNQQPLAGITLKDISQSSVFGHNRIFISPLKNRSKKRQRRSFHNSDELLNPVNIIRFVRDWTAALRRSAPPRIRDHLFLCGNRDKRQGDWIRSLGETTNGRYVGAQQGVYLYTKKKLGIHVGFRAIRADFADMLDEIFDGDLSQIGTLLGHSSISVTGGNYRKEEAKRRGQNGLAGAMAVRQRIIESGGRADPRPTSELSDRTSATPGWRCLDPHNSPIRGQLSGRLCTSYGMCPSCPLGTPVSNKAEALLRMLQLKERFEESKEDLGAAQWDKVWGKTYQVLVATHIPRYSSNDIVAEAMSLTLNPIPRLT